jgi:hypothetical protein
VSPQNQVHDYNPGIAANGLFWTIAVPDHALRVEGLSGEASLRIRDLAVEDYHDIVNALKDGPSVPGRVSFDVEWSDPGMRGSFSNAAADQRFSMKFVRTSAQIHWSGTNSMGASFTSTDSGQKVNFAQIARERNGTFFDEKDDSEDD